MRVIQLSIVLLAFVGTSWADLPILAEEITGSADVKIDKVGRVHVELDVDADTYPDHVFIFSPERPLDARAFDAVSLEYATVTYGTHTLRITGGDQVIDLAIDGPSNVPDATFNVTRGLELIHITTRADPIRGVNLDMEPFRDIGGVYQTKGFWDWFKPQRKVPKCDTGSGVGAIACSAEGFGGSPGCSVGCAEGYWACCNQGSPFTPTSCECRPKEDWDVDDKKK